MKSFFFSLRHALRGVCVAWREERNFRLQIILATLALIAALVLRISASELAIVIFCIALVLGAEILNTLVEDLCNKLEPQFDPVIGKLKDLMAAIVLVQALGAFIIGMLIFWPYLGLVQS